jgi:hypothetical protein
LKALPMISMPAVQLVGRRKPSKLRSRVGFKLSIRAG